MTPRPPEVIGGPQNGGMKPALKPAYWDPTPTARREPEPWEALPGCEKAPARLRTGSRADGTGARDQAMRSRTIGVAEKAVPAGAMSYVPAREARA